jgi:tetratricopeptide (TPR) repeat protein
MKQTTVAALALAAALASGAPALAQDAASAPKPPPGAKVINDPPEFNAFKQAMNQQDPAQHAAAMEAFVAAYPNSIVKEDALEQALSGYQRAGDAAKVGDTAQQLLDADAKNLRALAILTTLERVRFNNGDATALAPMGEHANTGLATLPGWAQPAGVADDAFKTLHDTMAVAFEGAHGLALLQTKDFEGARKAYLKALAIDPANLEDAYQIGVAELQTKPLRVGAFWWLARAYDLAGAQNRAAVQQAIGAYAKGKYVAYHGGDDGWDAIVASAVDKPKPPDDFTGSAAPPKK